ncbi:hypothetical protein [Aurantibacillus circumpalustris]|uniref:hypothetical protein n=1 Tax=Aurantibacillus circumpalustris TaxID=3036359 RepID=UPI00295BB890|nr:hypothetical protein [Aurantibacillus circumpalustris]
MKYLLVFTTVIFSLLCCTKEQGKNPSLSITDVSLLDSCAQSIHAYYNSDPNILLSGAHGPHGTFKLRFNNIANKVLTDKGKLPLGTVFPDGSLVIKDIYSGSDLTLYAFMYKHSGSWLWAEVKPNGSILHSVNENSGVCTGCHNQSGNRDLVVSFNFY